MKTDIVLPDYKVTPIDALSLSEVVDWGVLYLRAPDYWNENNRGEGAIAFILDTGGIIDHVDLAGNARNQYSKNYTNDPSRDGNGHSTHCAGIVGAVDNEQGVVGIAPGVGLVGMKVLGDSGGGSFAWIAQAIRDVADTELTGDDRGKKKIISMSLGTAPGFQTPANVRQAIDYAIERGVFIVAAAGNSGYTGDKSTVGAPGNYAPVLTVASSARPGNRRSGFSSGGEEVDLIAPGSGIYSTHLNNGYAHLSGTSMACPQVTGVVALILTQFPEITNQSQLTQFLTAHATDILAPGRDNESGYGSPIVVNYLNQTPDGTPPDDGDGDNGDDDDNGGGDPPVDEPDVPNPPRRDTEATVVVPLRGMLFAMQYTREGDRLSSIGTVRDLSVRVTSDIRTDALIDIVREYVESYFAGRMLVLKPGHDLYEAAIWTGVFMQFIADDDYVYERFGVRLKLTVESLSLSDHQAREVTVDQQAIARRGEYEPTSASTSVHMVKL